VAQNKIIFQHLLENNTELHQNQTAGERNAHFILFALKSSAVTPAEMLLTSNIHTETVTADVSPNISNFV
jgi:hypothetical protein